VKRIITGLALFIFIIITTTSPALADNANPPKIVSVEQATKGPYSIGDIVTYKINYTGGNPGIRTINVKGAGSKETCVTLRPSTFVDEYAMSQASYFEISWDKKMLSKNLYPEPFLVSGVVMPCQGKDSNKWLSILDETGLTARLEDYGNKEPSPLAALRIEVNSFDFITPVGEIKPVKIKDSISLKNVPKSPKAKTSFELPRLTRNGVPVSFYPSGSCSIVQKTFDGDIGGTLKFNRSGECRLTAFPMWTDKYFSPTFEAKVKFSSLKGFSVTGFFIVRK
jgi:hypothetical protein